jgi:hypothetical protein
VDAMDAVPFAIAPGMFLTAVKNGLRTACVSATVFPSVFCIDCPRLFIFDPKLFTEVDTPEPILLSVVDIPLYPDVMSVASEFLTEPSVFVTFDIPEFIPASPPDISFWRLPDIVPIVGIIWFSTLDRPVLKWLISELIPLPMAFTVDVALFEIADVT